MSPYNGRRVFRSPRWLLGLVILGEAIFASGLWYHVRTQGWSWMTLAFAGLTIIGVLAIVETIVQRVELTDDTLQVIRWYARRSYPKGQIVRVTWAKGTSVHLELSDGRFVELPAVGPHPPNSIRAWLKAKD